MNAFALPSENTNRPSPTIEKPRLQQRWTSALPVQRDMARIATLVTFAACMLDSSRAFDVCGNYCGPSWCGGEVKEECADPNVGRSCKPSGENCQEMSPTDGSCADDCCRTHDACCGSSDRSPCNTHLIQCLKSCENDPAAKTCHRGDIPVPIALILTGMELDPYGCCGTSCS